MFEHYPWPGNVRQLRREVERAVALTPNGEPLVPDRCSPEITLGARDFDLATTDELSLPSRIKELEVKLIRAALERTAEAKHGHQFVEMVLRYESPETVYPRLRKIVEREAAIIETLEWRASLH